MEDENHTALDVADDRCWAEPNGMKECYKIKLRGAGYRLVYRVEDERIVILVLVIGKRERSSVYEQAGKR